MDHTGNGSCESASFDGLPPAGAIQDKKCDTRNEEVSPGEVAVILGLLTRPTDTPIVPMAMIGFLSTWSWKWFFAWMLSLILIPLVMGIGRTQYSLASLRGVLNSYLSSNRYRCKEFSPDLKDLVSRFNLWKHQGYSSSQEPTKRSVRFFLVEGTDRMARLSITAQCFAGGTTRPAVVFLRRKPTTSEFTLFEFTHELGHASLEASDTEALRSVEPLLIVLSAFAFLCAAGLDQGWAALASLYIILRLRYWWNIRRDLEPEIIADAVAIKCTPIFDHATSAVYPLTQHLQTIAFNEQISRRKRKEAKSRLGMIGANLTLHKSGREKIMTRAVIYDPTIILMNVLFISAPIWGSGHPQTLCIALTMAAAFSAVLVFISVVWEAELESRFDKLLQLGGKDGTPR